MNATLLKKSTAAEALHSMTEPEKQTPNKTLGTLLHIAALEPHRLMPETWEESFVLCPTAGLDTKAAREVAAANPGKLLITADLLDSARQCREAILWNDEAQRWLQPEGGRHTEATGIVWDAQRFHCWRKIRLDVLPVKANFIADVKTTSADLAQFERECWKFGYFLQAAWYLDTHRLLTGRTLPYFVFVAVTTAAPFLSRVVIVHNRALGDPLYADSVIGKARMRLGLDDSERLSRAAVILNSMRQTEAARDQGIDLTPGRLRSMWPGYEDETPPFEIL